MTGTMRSCRGWGLLAVVAFLELMLSWCRQQFRWAKAPAVLTFLCDFLFVQAFMRHPLQFFLVAVLLSNPCLFASSWHHYDVT